ncbi:hypothetical protein [Kribbella sp. NPDC051137]|uniref:hypothetical protein n=1 Tax=Kribbella sp. NPDC051137 TaxID=3155045 RepID=UPI0034361F93
MMFDPEANRPDDARYVDPSEPRRTPAELGEIREQEIRDGWARVAKEQRAEQERTDRELARQTERLAADHPDGADA